MADLQTIPDISYAPGTFSMEHDTVTITKKEYVDLCICEESLNRLEHRAEAAVVNASVG